MTDLQLILIAAGVAVITGVWLYNRLQERRLRRRLDEAFGELRHDALLEEGAAEAAAGTAERIEPRIQSAVAGGTASGRFAAEDPAPAERVRASAFEPDPELDCVAEIEAAGAISGDAINELIAKLADCGRPTHVLGTDAGEADETGWREIHHGAAVRVRRLQVALQLVNRSGSVSAAQLAMFCDAVRACAERSGGKVSLPDAARTLAMAQELDGFCGEVDVAVGVNVVAPEEGGFPGPRIRELAEDAGFRLEPDGAFHVRDAQRRTLFTLDNQQPVPFVPERLSVMTTPGVTLTLDVPRVADGPAALDRMISIGAALAHGLGGELVDDNRAVLSAGGIEKIRQQLRSITSRLEARGMPAGGERALRLFS